MNLLVTGAVGFTGSRHVRTRLAADAPRTTVLDALTYAGTLALDHFRPEPVHGDIRARWEPLKQRVSGGKP